MSNKFKEDSLDLAGMAARPTNPIINDLYRDKGGRPTSYTQELADKICEQLAQGLSMRTISKDDTMPAMSTMFEWLRIHKEFTEQYARAKQESADAMAEDILDIADDGSNDYMETDGGKEQYNGESVQRSRLRVDTRKWLMAKMKPKVYGDKLDLTNDGSKFESPIIRIIDERVDKNTSGDIN